MKISKHTTALAAAAVLLVMSNVGHAASPTQADFDACNKEAQARATSPAASPGTSATTPTTPSTPPPASGPSGSAPASPSAGAASDSQLTGMAAAGQADPAYQQAYRECLKRRGF